MNDIIKIAWRNLWRNRRRTVITAASIFFAIFFAIIMRSFQLGTYGFMIEQSIEAYSGYLQLQNPDYFDDPSIDNSFEVSAEMIQKVKNNPNVKAFAPRIESFALASTGNISKGVLVSGIDPIAESSISNPEHNIVRYRITEKALLQMNASKALPDDLLSKLETLKNTSFSSDAKLEIDLNLDSDEAEKYLPIISKYCHFESNYLKPDDDGVLIADRLSRYLKLGVGDSLVLIGQGYHGVSAAGIYPVRGIVKIASPDLDNKLIYMNIAEAKKFLGLDQQITSLVINLNDIDEMLQTQNELKTAIGSGNFVIKNWEETMPTLKQQIESDSVSGQVFIFILYVIVFFGIFGTVIMMIAERKREFGVMIAIGMKRKKLTRIVNLEMLFLGITGAVTGMIATIPLLLYGHYYPFQLSGEMAKMMEDMGFVPVMPMALFDAYFYNQALIVFAMILVVCLVPISSIKKLDVIKALRG
ncbi:MAG: FtsX-like permease family protein [Prolixibacteraceae bacterium]